MTRFPARDRAWHPEARAPAYKSSLTRSPAEPLVALAPTESEMTGPRFGAGMVAAGESDLLTNFAQPGESPVGERILLFGHVRDEGGRPVPGALIEIWQANAGGRYRHANDGYRAPLDPNFGGAGRVLTDAKGAYAFQTIKPGAYPWPNWTASWRPPHIHLSIFGEAMAQRLITQVYFEGDPLIAACPIVQAIPSQEAISRLIARLDMAAARPFDSLAYRFDVVLRGRHATPFENRPEGT